VSDALRPSDSCCECGVEAAGSPCSPAAMVEKPETDIFALGLGESGGAVLKRLTLRLSIVPSGTPDDAKKVKRY